jgi:hypothetical protein
MTAASKVPSVYVDANVFKFAASKLPRLFRKTQQLNWGNKRSVHEYWEPGYLDPNDAIKDPELKAEAKLLEKLAAEACAVRVILITHHESLTETWGLPNMDSIEGRFYGTPIGRCPSPVIYSRIVVGGSRSMQELQENFLISIRNSRFEEIQRAVGAIQGRDSYNENQLMDAFAIWCAESAGCDAFLSLDFKLARVIANDRKKRVKIRMVRPSELVAMLES